MQPKIVVITGPTASGKTALGVALAQRLGGEVVSADSMQHLPRHGHRHGQANAGRDAGRARPAPCRRGTTRRRSRSISPTGRISTTASTGAWTPWCARACSTRSNSPPGAMPKRQLTWLRRDPDLFWIRHEKTPDMDRACRLSTQFLSGRGIE